MDIPGKQYVTALPRYLKCSGQHIIGYLATDRFCVGCTLRGTNVQPAFWKNQYVI